MVARLHHNRAVTMRSLELKIPPPAVGLVTALLMWLASQAVPSFTWPSAVRIAAAIVLVAIGACITIAGVVSFMRARTTINPVKPSSASSLVITGIYRFTRNPMYLGSLFILLGWAVFLANVLAFLLLPGFVLYINRFQITPEETALSGIFGSEFATYKANVRRWL